ARRFAAAAVQQTSDWPPVSLARPSVRPAYRVARAAGTASLRPPRRAGAGARLLRDPAAGRAVAGTAGDRGAGRLRQPGELVPRRSHRAPRHARPPAHAGGGRRRPESYSPGALAAWLLLPQA